MQNLSKPPGEEAAVDGDRRLATKQKSALPTTRISITKMKEKLNPRNPPRVFTREKHANPRQILRPPQAAEGVHPLQLSPRGLVFEERQSHRRARVARREGVDVDAVRRAVQSRGAREVHHGGLGGAVLFVPIRRVQERRVKFQEKETKTQTASIPHQPPSAP